MNISRTMRAHIAFARFADEHQLKPLALAELLTLARRAYSAGVEECNRGRSANGARGRFADQAHALGFTVSWSGLWPTLHKGSNEIYLPDV